MHEINHSFHDKLTLLQFPIKLDSDEMSRYLFMNSIFFFWSSISDFLLPLVISFFVSQIVSQKPRKEPSQDGEQDDGHGSLFRKPKYWKIRTIQVYSYDNVRKRGNPNDEDWFGSDNRKYMLKKSKGGNKSMFRTNSRGSKKKITKIPKLLTHESSPDDPPVRVKQFFLFYFLFPSIYKLFY